MHARMPFSSFLLPRLTLVEVNDDVRDRLAVFTCVAA
jgi:hypothetical protein